MTCKIRFAKIKVASSLLPINEGSGPEWSSSSMLYSRDIPFWPGTLELCREQTICFQGKRYILYNSRKKTITTQLLSFSHRYLIIHYPPPPSQVYSNIKKTTCHRPPPPPPPPPPPSPQLDFFGGWGDGVEWRS